MLVGSLSLMRLPFLTGFYSKDLIVEVAYGSRTLVFGFWLAVFSAFLTTFYSFRLIYFCFASDFQELKKSVEKIHEGNWPLILPLFELLVLAILGGFLSQNFILRYQFPVILCNFTKFVTLLVTSLGYAIALLLGLITLLYWKAVRLKVFHQVYAFTSLAWYFDRVIAYYFVHPVLKLGFNTTYKFIDNQVLKGLRRYWVSNYLRNKASFSIYYRGYIHSYLFLFVISVICFIIQL